MASTSSSQQQQPQPQQQQQQSDFQSAHTSHLDHNNYVTSENQLAGLVQAATAAAGQDVSDWAAAAAAAAAAGHHQLESYSDLHLPEDSFGDGEFCNLGGPAPTTGRQMRGSTANGQGQGLSRAVSKKRKRGEEVLDPALTGPGGQGDQHQTFDGSELNIRELPPQQSLTDARAAGVHSAAALFRQPSNNKKYTRPPMSRLFASLELSPENFLHLQAAAKNYMLDDNHPERRDCVGQRGKGDTEMVKLRLWNCVRNFLENEGYGERFFGEHVVNEGMPPRQFIWPRDQHKIISLVIPLLRRMVTNERQRQYAIETRKGGAAEERKRRKTDETVQDLNAPEGPPQGLQHERQQTHTQSHGHHGSDNFLQPPPPPPLPSHDVSASGPDMGLGLSQLVLDGYSADWDNVSKSYSSFNQDYQLDTLWGISGLPQPDWWGLVAAVDSHYQVLHHGNPMECPPDCEKHQLDRILLSDEVARLDWRIGGGTDVTARSEFASSITRDLTRIIKENYSKKGEDGTPSHLGATTHADHTHGISHASYMPSIHQSPFDSTAAPNHETSPITLRFNVIQDGKRVVPRLDVTAEQCPDLASLRNLIVHRFSAQLPTSTLDGNGNVDTSRWKIQVWLPEGLVQVANDGDWTIAQLSAGTIDWMDNDLRVVIDIGDEPKRQEHLNQL